MKMKTLKSLLALLLAANPNLMLLAGEDTTEYPTFEYSDLGDYEEYSKYVEEKTYFYEEEIVEEYEDFEYLEELEYEEENVKVYEEEIEVLEDPLEELIAGFHALSAEYPVTGILNLVGEETAISLRAYPYSTAAVLASLNSGEFLTIVDVTVINEEIWFYAQNYYVSGYIHGGNFVTNHPDFMQWRETFHIDVFGRIQRISPRARFAPLNATNLNAFPASYRPQIQALMALRPNWTFVPFNTGRDWNTEVAVQMECPGVTRNCRSLVPWDSPASWIDNDRRVEPNWVQASEGILRYFMDPRNFINDQDIFQFEVLSFNAAAHTLAATDGVLQNTFMHSTAATGRRLANGQSYAQVFFDLGREFNISPLLLAGRVRQEQGVQGTSGLISGTFPGFEGLFNYFNFGATAGGGSTQNQIVAAGLTLARNESWTTRNLALRGGAQRLGGEWIPRGQNTLYLQKFDVRPNRDWPRNFMQNILHPRSVARNVRASYANMGSLNSSFVFSIPVFEEMPGQASPEPGTTPPPALPNQYGHITSGVNFRTGAGNTTSIIRALSAGTSFIFLREQNGWWNVRIGSQTGWIHSNHGTLGTSAGHVTSGVNFRTGAGNTTSVIRALSAGTSFTFLREQNGWWNVQIGNQTGWLHGNHGTLGTSAGHVTSGVNFRTGAGNTTSIIRSLAEGTSFTFLREQNGWWNVRIGSQTGWIHGHHGGFGTSTGTITSGVNFRTGAGNTTSVIRPLTTGTNFTFLREQNGWWNVRIGQEEGWVHGNHATLGTLPR